MRVVFLIVLFCFSISFADDHIRFGSDFSVEIDSNGIGQTSIIRVITEPEKMQGQELVISVQNSARETAVRTALPPSEDGVYTLPIGFDREGEWGMWMRYGLGLENYERVRRFNIRDEVERVEVGSSTFRNYFLKPDVPDYVQPMGYAIFGILLLCVLLMLARLFYWINRQHNKLIS